MEDDDEVDDGTSSCTFHPSSSGTMLAVGGAPQASNVKLVQTVPAKEPRLDAIPLKSAMKKGQQQQVAMAAGFATREVQQQQQQPAETKIETRYDVGTGVKLWLYS